MGATSVTGSSGSGSSDKERLAAKSRKILNTVKNGVSEGVSISSGSIVGTDMIFVMSDSSTVSVDVSPLIQNNIEVVDEDNMLSDSDTKVPTQQSVKAYVDANSGSSSGSVQHHTVGLEHDTGEDWVDGSRIYRQSFQITMQSVTSGHVILSGVRRLIRSEGVAWNVQFNGSSIWPQPQHEGDTSFNYPYINGGTDVQLFFSSNWAGGSPSPILECTLYYTKV